MINRTTLLKRLRNIAEPSSQAHALASKMEGVISLYGGEPEFDTPKHIIDAAKKALDEGYTHYGPPSGYLELREAISDYYKRYDVEVDPRSVFVTPGSTSALHITMTGIFGPGDEIIVPDPEYQAYVSRIQFCGGSPIFVPRDEKNEWRIEPKNIEKAITSRTKAIIICNPDNPTGAIMSKDDIEKLADIVKKHDLIVISDDIYDQIIYDESKFYSIAALPGLKERTFIINGFSKIYSMTGWRLGYVIAPDSIAPDLRNYADGIFFRVNAVVQQAGIAALRGPQEHIKEMLREHKRKRDLVVDTYNSIDGVSCVKPRGSLYAFPNISSFGLTSLKFEEFMVKEARVLLRAGVRFGPTGEGHMRSSFAQSMEDLKEALARFEIAIKKLK